jgi:hypothetical protein
MNTVTNRDETDREVLENFELIYKTQQGAISRRLLGDKGLTNCPVKAYLTHDELEAVKDLAQSVGLNVSTLVRLTMTTLAAAGLSSTYGCLDDPRDLQSL